MKRKTAEEILSASKPRDIFTMNPAAIEQEKDEYIEAFRPQDYSTIKNFMVTQKVILLYRQALDELGDSRAGENARYTFTIHAKNGSTYEVHADYVYKAKIGNIMRTMLKKRFVQDSLESITRQWKVLSTCCRMFINILRMKREMALLS